MKQLSIACLALIGCFAFWGCINEIKLDIDGGQQWLVVDGQLTDSLQLCQIKISYSAIIGVGNDNILTPITGCTVRVLDDIGGSFEFPETTDGIYSREMEGEHGRLYHVEVQLPSGKTILSRPAALEAAPALLPPTAEIIEKTTISPTGKAVTSNQLFLKMNADVGNGTPRPYLRWRATGEYEFKEAYPMALSTKTCYIKDNVDFNNIKIFNANELPSTTLTDEPFLTTSYNYRFADMYCFHLFQYSIGAEEYKYWESVRDIVNIDGSLFDPPPGTVRGNLYDPADPDELILGYFSVAGVAYRREFLNANSLGFFVEPKCSSLPFRPQYAECRACETILFSSTEKPAYWEP